MNATNPRPATDHPHRMTGEDYTEVRQAVYAALKEKAGPMGQIIPRVKQSPHMERYTGEQIYWTAMAVLHNEADPLIHREYLHPSISTDLWYSFDPVAVQQARRSA